MGKLLVYFILDNRRSCVVDIPVHRRRVIPSTGTAPKHKALILSKLLRGLFLWKKEGGISGPVSEPPSELVQWSFSLATAKPFKPNLAQRPITVSKQTYCLILAVVVQGI